jgi:hypothetical protein
MRPRDWITGAVTLALAAVPWGLAAGFVAMALGWR